MDFEKTPDHPIRFHPAAEIFPWIDGTEYREFVEDIRANGVLDPIVFIGDEILDGRNRYMAARELGIEYPRIQYEGDDPVGYVIAHNLRRRHLSSSQKSMAAARIAKLQQGQRQTGKFAHLLSVEQAAAMVQVSERSVKSARAVLDDGAPELQAAVDANQIAVSTAATIASVPVDQQVEIIARGPDEILAAAKQINAEKAARSRERRMARVAAVEEPGKVKTASGIPKGFPVIYADPPWKNEVFSEETGAHKSPPYPVMELDDICQLCAGENSPATADAVLFLWVTGNRIHHGIAVMTAWGFEFKTSAVWDKVNIGMGRWFRDRHEILLVGTKGNIPAPLPGMQAQSLFAEAKGAHSTKPSHFQEVIESYFPDLPKLELFARGKREGWITWGYEA